MGDDLIAFLTARLDEDEAAAKAATPGKWLALDGGVQSADDETQWPVSETKSARDRADRVHIARHDPARALREVEFGRVILAEHRQGGGDSIWCHRCDPGADMEDQRAWYPCFTLRSLAAIWSDHPDYRAEWKP